MIGTIRRHQKWLWIFIISVTIITFVPFVANTPSLTGGSDHRPNMELGSLNGAPITIDQYKAARNDEHLFYFFHFGKWPTEENMRQNRFDMENRTYQRILFNEKIRELNVQVSPAASARMIKEMFGLKPEDAVPMDKFQKLIVNELGSKGFTMGDFERFIRDQVGQQHLISLFGMTGKLITADEAKYLYKRENEQMIAQLVRFPGSSYESATAPKAEDLEKYFSDRQSEYWLPERVQVNYLKFASTNYLAEADKEMAANTNMTSLINQIYMRDPSAFKDDKGKAMSEADAKADIKKRLRNETALTIANKKAGEFLKDLHAGHDEKNPFKPDDMEKLAKSKGLTLKTTELFDRNGPKNMDVPPRFVQFAFGLKENNPDDKSNADLYSSTIRAEDGTYLLGFKQHVPAQPQQLAAVREQVTRDYRREKGLDTAREAGHKFQVAVTNGLAAGKSFETICTEQKLKPQTLSPFSLSSTNIAEVANSREAEQLQSVAFNVATGKASSFIPTVDGGFLVYVKDRKPVDTAKMEAEIPNFLNRLRDQRQMAAFNDWFQKQWVEMKMQVPDKKKVS